MFQLVNSRAVCTSIVGRFKSQEDIVKVPCKFFAAQTTTGHSPKTLHEDEKCIDAKKDFFKQFESYKQEAPVLIDDIGLTCWEEVTFDDCQGHC